MTSSNVKIRRDTHTVPAARHLAAMILLRRPLRLMSALCLAMLWLTAAGTFADSNDRITRLNDVMNTAAVTSGPMSQQPCFVLAPPLPAARVIASLPGIASAAGSAVVSSASTAVAPDDESSTGAGDHAAQSADGHDDHETGHEDDHGDAHGHGDGHGEPDLGQQAAAALTEGGTPGWYGGFVIAVAVLFLLALIIGTTAALARGEVSSPGLGRDDEDQGHRHDGAENASSVASH
ncbi:MAG: hypothetical protein ACOC0P_03135 [Planctomycetota bacterium]